MTIGTALCILNSHQLQGLEEYPGYIIFITSESKKTILDKYTESITGAYIVEYREIESGDKEKQIYEVINSLDKPMFPYTALNGNEIKNLYFVEYSKLMKIIRQNRNNLPQQITLEESDEEVD